MESVSNSASSISIIVPTRGRVEQLQRFLKSVQLNAARPDALEVIIVVDDDDEPSKHVTLQGLRTKTVEVPRGLTMGSLNMAGYRASTGSYIMLANDDVIVRSPGWDAAAEAVFRSFADDIVLVHVNDGIFQEKLCTFPFLTRRFCEMAGGISHEGYRRYRIDDEIYNVFNLLAVLGHRRIVYLPDVLFEHQNFSVSGLGGIEYRPVPEIHAADTEIFDARLDVRKELGIRLARWIDEFRASTVDNSRRKILRPISDSVSLRKLEYVRRFERDLPKAGQDRVTVGVVSANLNAEHARICIDALKKHTESFDLVVLDNNRGPGFNHSREMNRILSVCRTDYLVLMDDDVWVSPGWLENMLSCMKPDVGVVTPVHLAKDGKISYAGIVMRPDSSGNHSHRYEPPTSSTPIQTLCSAVMLIDMNKVGHLRVDESYSKYFLDIDYGLRVWEAGYKVVLSTQSICTHLGGATLTQGSALSTDLFETQRRHWVRDWIDTGRFAKLRDRCWGDVTAIQAELAFPSELESLLEGEAGESVEDFLDRALPVFAKAQSVPALLEYARDRLREFLNDREGELDEKKRRNVRLIYGLSGLTTLVERNFEGYDNYVAGTRFFATKAGWPLTGSQALGVNPLGPFVADSLVTLRERIRRDLPVVVAASAASPGISLKQQLLRRADAYVLRHNRLRTLLRRTGLHRIVKRMGYRRP
jgi:GT2 family glycosyltransferase